MFGQPLFAYAGLLFPRSAAESNNWLSIKMPFFALLWVGSFGEVKASGVLIRFLPSD